MYHLLLIFFLLENNDVTKDIQSISWCKDGYKIAVSSRDLKLHIFDIKSNKMEMETNNHQNIRDSRVLWLNEHFILTTGTNIIF